MKHRIKYFFLMSSAVLLSIIISSFKTDYKWKYGVALYTFNYHSFATGLDMASRAGLKNIEGFSFQKVGDEFGDKTLQELNVKEVDRIKRLLKERKISMSSLYVSDAKGVEDWERYFKLAKKLEVKYLVSEPKQEDLDVIDSLAEKYKIKLAIHQHAKPGPYWHPDSVLNAVKGRKNIGACADIGHWLRSGVNPMRGIEKLAGKIIGIHLKDVTKEGKDVALGEGAIDFPQLVKELKRQGYSGYINVECEYNWEDNTNDVRRALVYLNGITQGNGK